MVLLRHKFKTYEVTPNMQNIKKSYDIHLVEYHCIPSGSKALPGAAS